MKLLQLSLLRQTQDLFISKMLVFRRRTTAKHRCRRESIFTPIGWLNALNINAKNQYKSFQPDSDDTLRALTIVSKGCVNGTTAGPVCDSITRVALLSDKAGGVVVEAIKEASGDHSWHNGFGASTSCSTMVSRFSLADVQKVRNNKGEFLIATFGGSTLLKVWTVKEKHVKKLGL